MSKINQKTILETAVSLFAHGGLGEFRIRLLADKIGISPSVIYHYFQDEKTLLKEMFDYSNTELGAKRHLLPPTKSPSQMLKQRIEFQLDNAEKIVAVLKYYFAFRDTFPKHKQGFIPEKGSLHIEEVLQFAQAKGDYVGKDLKADAKVITHAINGFLLEYYPYKLEGKEKTELINRIYNFLNRILKGGE